MELHVTEPVRFCVLLSLYVPVAVNCCVAPTATEDWPASPQSTPTRAPSPSARGPADRPRGRLNRRAARRHACRQPPLVIVATAVWGTPGHRTGQVLRAAVAVHPRGGELLRAPVAMEALAGVTVIEGKPTYRQAVEPLMAPEVA